MLADDAGEISGNFVKDKVHSKYYDEDGIIFFNGPTH